MSLPAIWPQPDGSPVACREKLKVLAENHEELGRAMQDAFEDAILMGVDASAMRSVLIDIVHALRTPRQGGT